jgi:hypothetical protein
MQLLDLVIARFSTDVLVPHVLRVHTVQPHCIHSGIACLQPAPSAEPTFLIAATFGSIFLGILVSLSSDLPILLSMKSAGISAAAAA